MSNYELKIYADDIKTYANIRSSDDAAGLNSSSIVF